MKQRNVILNLNKNSQNAKTIFIILQRPTYSFMVFAYRLSVCRFFVFIGETDNA